MKRILLLFTLALTTLFVSCSKEEIFTNPYGSELVKKDGIKISSFNLSGKNINISYSMDNILIHLYSLSTGDTSQFEARLKIHDSTLLCAMHIPAARTIPDSDYQLRLSSMDGKFFNRRFSVTIKNEMVSAVTSDTYDFCLTKGKGTLQDPFRIENHIDFVSFSIDIEEEPSHCAGLYYEQLCDIISNSEGTEGIGEGHVCQEFAGYYDGCGHTIEIYRRGATSSGQIPTDETYIGLFSAMHNGSSVSNLNVKFSFNDLTENVGGIAGACYGNILVDNVNVTGSYLNLFADPTGTNHIGGFFGYSHNSTIKINNSSFRVELVGGNNVGGVLGFGQNVKLIVNGLSSPTFNCIRGNSEIGGLVGTLIGSAELNNIELKHESNGNESLLVIYGEGNYVGGLMGKFIVEDNSTIDNTRIIMPINGDGECSLYIGGLVGDIYSKSDASLTLCDVLALDEKVVGYERVGGFFGHASGLDFIFSDNDKDDQHNIQANKVRGNTKIGGVFGHIQDCNVTASQALVINTAINTAGVEATRCGGFAGMAENCDIQKIGQQIRVSNSSVIFGTQDIGGFVGYSSDSKYKGGEPLVFDNNHIYSKSQLEHPAFSGKINYENQSLEINYVGGFVGFCKGGSISCITVAPTIDGTNFIGGFGGHLQNTKIDNLASNGACVSGTGRYTSGLIAKMTLGQDATFTNLLNTTDVKGSHHIGGIFGDVDAPDNDSELILCVNTGNISVNDYAANESEVIGGIVGQCGENLISFKDCANFGDISSNKTGSGLAGIVGQASQKLKMEGCYNAGDITLNGNDCSFYGIAGIAGHVGTDSHNTYNDNNDIYISDCCNRGTIKLVSGYSHLGGIVGALNEGAQDQDNIVTDCYNYGEVLDASGWAGGILGVGNDHIVIKHCINYSKITRQDDDGNVVIGAGMDNGLWSGDPVASEYYYLEGTGDTWGDSGHSFTQNSGQDQSTFSLLDFIYHWEINSSVNNGLPYLTDCYFQFATPPEK